MASDHSFMSSSLHQIEKQARALSAEDRAKLAECMLESLHTSIEEIEAAWSEEIALRIEAFEKGDICAYSAEQVFAEARQILE
ncbi:addiction module protein [Cyanobium sp. FGCU-6]|jgi:putative addiction module component (TIGR02574 family)|nr:addiction module protein [Cyanobium sp. FGCU6]